MLNAKLTAANTDRYFFISNPVRAVRNTFTHTSERTLGGSTEQPQSRRPGSSYEVLSLEGTSVVTGRAEVQFRLYLESRI